MDVDFFHFAFFLSIVSFLFLSPRESTFLRASRATPFTYTAQPSLSLSFPPRSLQRAQQKRQRSR